MAAEKALAIVVEGQHSSGGWDYNCKQSMRDDTSYMGWCVQALKAAKMGGLEHPGLDAAMARAVKGMQKGKVKPFTALSLGGSRFADDSGDNWYFSILVSLGAKIHLNDKIGIMGSGQMGISFTDAFAGIGTGGVSIGGTGITQFDLVAGLIITL